MTSLQYPDGTVHTYTFDAMGRTNGYTGSSGGSSAVYGAAGELTSLNGDTRTYNSLLQLTRITAPGQMDIEYRYTAGQNNGRIASEKNWITGEETSYGYDALNRLASATGSGWSQTFGYDGFGNLTGKTGTGGAPSLTASFDPATNRQVGAGLTYDANGNQGPGEYDVENRLVTPSGAPFGGYVYDHQGKRVYWERYECGAPCENGTWRREVYFYGIGGQKLATYNNGWKRNEYLAGRLVRDTWGTVRTDRLGSVRWNGQQQTMHFYPYGEERGSTANGQEKFGTYFRDESGLDYADQRYYGPGTGRFTTPDPYRASGGPADPGSWNRYAYVGGDPINRIDPSGLSWDWTDSDWSIIDCLNIRWFDPACFNKNGPNHPGGGPNFWSPDDQARGGGGRDVLVHVGNPRKDGSEYDDVQTAFARTLAFLDPDCEKFLNSGGGDVRSYVSDLFAHNLAAVGDFDPGKAAFTNATGTNLPDGYAAIVFNSASAFFNDTVAGTNTRLSVNNGRIAGGSAQAQVFIILHELGHALGTTGFKSDLNNPGNGRDNDNLINSNCSKTFGAVR